MDHLPLPQKPILVSKIVVPFLAEDPYDGDDFMSYPARNGWHLSGPYVGCTIMRNDEPVSVSAVGAMLQTWLWYGLLHAVTGELLDDQLFCRRLDSGRRVMDTHVLGEVVSQWSSKVAGSDWSKSETKLQEWKNKSYGCLLEARDVILRINSTQKYRDLALLCMSVAVLGEYLLQAMKDIFSYHGLESPVAQSWRPSGCFDTGEPILQEMLQNGWCPKTISGLDTPKRMSVGKLWFLANMNPPTPPSSDFQDHSVCSKTWCAFDKVDEANYRVLHAMPSCSCKDVGPPMNLVGAALAAGVIPLLKVIDAPKEGHIGQAGHLEVERYAEGTEFVAISHVWSDGHGNPKNNKLPGCVLQNLSGTIRALPGNLAKFWMDTLCVPTQPEELRTMAVRLLKAPYINATHVLIVSSYLEGLKSAHMSPVEVVARIEACTWSQRLWTFQEGRLGRRVWFKFQDGTVELSDLIGTVWLGHFRRIPALPSHSVDLEILVAYNSSSTWKQRQLQDMSINVPFIRHSLSARQTSKAKDEAICLASVMSLPIEEILKVPDDEKMYKFWSLLQTVPKGMALSTASKKIKTAGYRWAPQSLMGDLESQRWGGPQGLFEDITARPSPSGLLVRLPVRLLLCLQGTKPLRERYKGQARIRLFKLLNQDTSCVQSVVFRDNLGRWYKCRLGQNWHQVPAQVEPSEEIAILLGYPGRKPDSNTSAEGDSYRTVGSVDGIVVTYHRPNDGDCDHITAKAHRHVTLDECAPNACKVWESLHSLIGKVMEMVYEEVSPGSNESTATDIGLQEAITLRSQALLAEDTELLKMGKQLNVNSNEDSSDVAVLRDLGATIRHFLHFTPWLGISNEEEKDWCIS